MMTSQQVFDKVVTHLRKQNEQARSPIGLCAYRGVNGTMCAAGCLIDEAQYDPDLEGVVVTYASPVSEALFHSGVAIEDVELVRSLQAIHDNCDPTEWEASFRALAADFGLTFDPKEGGEACSSS